MFNADCALKKLVFSTDSLVHLGRVQYEISGRRRATLVDFGYGDWHCGVWGLVKRLLYRNVRLIDRPFDPVVTSPTIFSLALKLAYYPNIWTPVEVVIRGKAVGARGPDLWLRISAHR
jgi:hypothetical protein